MPSLCPCCSMLDYELCCKSFTDGKKAPKTPEQLMRSRYTAYSQANIAYIKKTMQGKPLINFNEEEAHKWASSVHWLGLKIVSSTIENEDIGFVEFIASFLKNNQVNTMHERSEFHRKKGIWFYVDGINTEQSKIKQEKISRNTPCPCGSGKKIKNCYTQG